MKTGVSRPNISFWEKSDFPPLEGIDRVCRALGMELWQFFADEEALRSMVGVADEFAGIMGEVALMDDRSRNDIREIMNLVVQKYRTATESGRDAVVPQPAEQPAIPDPDGDHYRLNPLAQTALGAAVEDYMQRFIWLTSGGGRKPGKLQ